MSRSQLMLNVQHLATELKAIADTLDGHIRAGEWILEDVAGIDELSGALQRIAIGLRVDQTRPEPRVAISKEGDNIVRLNFGICTSA